MTVARKHLVVIILLLIAVLTLSCIIGVLIKRNRTGEASAEEIMQGKGYNVTTVMSITAAGGPGAESADGGKPVVTGSSLFGRMFNSSQALGKEWKQADDIEIAKNSLDVLHQVFQLGSSFSDVSKLLKFSGTLASVFPVLGAILGLVEGFLPGNHEEILSRFEELSNKVDQVRDDIQRLRIDLRWDLTELQYVGAVDCIESGIEYCLEIGKRSRQKEKTLYQEKLRAHCANENCASALRELLNGVNGEGIFRSSSILDKFYDKTEGNRSRISEFATRLLQLASGGIMVMSTYDTMTFGIAGAADTTKPFYSRLDTALSKVQSALDRCVTNFQGNMLNDLNGKLIAGRSNRDLAIEISYFMRYKYEWLENFVVVYNDLWGFDAHCFNGHRVDSLHRNGKCGIVFYRRKGEPPKFSDRYDEAYKIIDEGHCVNAKAGFDGFVAKLDVRGIGWTGFLVISRNDPDLRFKGTFSTRTIYVDKVQKLQAGLTSGDYLKKIILLLE